MNESRSICVLWLLEAAHIPYELIIYQRNQDNPLAPDTLKATPPLGKSPELEDNGEIIVESGAIVEYWIKRYASQFAPAEHSEDNIAYLQWIRCAESAAMTPMLFILFNGTLSQPCHPSRAYFSS
ncbi:glutathione S-transferase N-terminal domain-containing protein [Musicola paradisiaca]|uniref:Glutathione S-transferase n=1 Tax=Musicola paradisiaca (strain Ech703) TaxID=579405 RepID=C6C818_MUSP7|nr:glutathione S-transferase N-terminal domain-containing protein [Musicola paradisiaca]ACS84163.1 glutathione S-transferase [Musicola paradisiaca Ech703]